MARPTVTRVTFDLPKCKEPFFEKNEKKLKQKKKEEKMKKNQKSKKSPLFKKKKTKSSETSPEFLVFKV